MTALRMDGLRSLRIAAVGWIALVSAGLVASDWAVFVLTVALAKAMVVLGVTLLMRAGLVSFGQGLFFAAGAYTVSFAMRYGHITDALVLLLMAIVVSLLLAAVLGPLLSRYREIFFAMLTLAFSMIMYGILLKAYWFTGGTDGMGIREPSVLGIAVSGHSARITYYYLTVGIASLAVYAIHRFDASPLGYVIRAVRDNDLRLEYMGVSVRRALFVTNSVAAGLAGLGGALTAFSLGHITPDLAYWTTSGEFVFIALLSGAGSVMAPVAGSIVFQFLQTYASKYAPYTWQMVMGLSMLAIILFMPEGLWGLYQRLTGWRAAKGVPDGGRDLGNKGPKPVFRSGPGMSGD